MSAIQYLRELPLGKVVLWCYLIWYLVMVSLYFDPSLRLWLNSLGISAVIGTGLVLSVLPAGGIRNLERWQVFRLFLIPFCVSSFAALIKEQGFILVFSSSFIDNSYAVGSCAVFVSVVLLLKRFT